MNKPRKSIVEDRLRAARQAAGFTSPNQLAKKARLQHSTVSRILSRHVKKVNARTLERLSRALRVPAEWLTGELRDLPYVPEFEYPQSSSSQSRRSRKKPSLWERPTTDYVRWSWLMRQIEAAIRRDLADWCGDKANHTYDSWGRSLLTVFQEMAHSFVWRLVLQQPAREGDWDPLWQAEDVPTISWLEHALDPWLDGGAYLNADVIRELFGVLCTSPQRLWGSKTRDSESARALEEYARLCNRAVGKQLAEDLGPEEEGGSQPRRPRHGKRAAARTVGRQRNGDVVASKAKGSPRGSRDLGGLPGLIGDVI